MRLPIFPSSSISRSVYCGSAPIARDSCAHAGNAANAHSKSRRVSMVPQECDALAPRASTEQGADDQKARRIKGQKDQKVCAGRVKLTTLPNATTLSAQSCVSY
jgi:hypothetical protein